MLKNLRLQRRLTDASPVFFIAVAGFSAFAAYCCMYALRKPFAAAPFEGIEVWGVQYKIAAVIAQVAGYALSKFVGIRLVAAIRPVQRGWVLLAAGAWALLALLGFALAAPGWGLFWMFMNGLPLGITWGLVFAYLEGRRVTELLAAFLCANIIFSSALVKSAGKSLLDAGRVSDFWMPFWVGLLFFPLLLLCIWLLDHLPAPDPTDEAARSPRSAMSKADRRALFARYRPGWIMLIGIYLILTIIRDIRDNFAVEIWRELGWGHRADILTTAEVPVALTVLAGLSMLSWVGHNFRALYYNHAIVWGGALLLLLSTLWFERGILHPLVWMITSGVGILFPYILFNGAIFDRLLGAFREKGNVGFLMYMADAVGYLGSVAVLLWRNFYLPKLSWLHFYEQTCLAGALITGLLGLFSWQYFKQQFKKIQNA